MKDLLRSDRDGYKTNSLFGQKVLFPYSLKKFLLCWPTVLIIIWSC